MMKYCKIVNTVAIAGAAMLPLLMNAADDNKSEIRTNVNHYALSYAEKEKDADSLIRQANKAFGDKEYVKARDMYIEVKKILNALNANFYKEKVKVCDEQINQCYYQLALEAVDKAEESALINDYDEAIRLCKEAAKFYPDSRIAMEKRIAYYTDIRKKAALKNETSIGVLAPDKSSQDYEIQVLMRRGREYVNAGLYSKAKRAYDEILLYNPYHADALQNLKAVNNYITRAGEVRAMISRNRSITSNELEWALPIRSVKDRAVTVLDTPAEKSVSDNTVMVNKIKSIVIPKIDFNEVSLRSAIDTLVALSAQEDPEAVGINIFLREDLIENANTANAGGFGERVAPQNAGIINNPMTQNNQANDGGEAAAVVEEEINPEANFSALEKTLLIIPAMENKTIEEIIKSICNATKLRYRTEKYAVVLEPMNLPESGLETKIFPVDATSFADIDASNPAQLKEFFENNDVKFPSGSKIVFDSKISRIIATNTLANLEVIENICDESMNDQEPLIQIQLRIIEISQKDFNALGFNYSVSDSNAVPAFKPISTTDFMGAPGAPSVGGQFTAGDFTIGIDINAINQLDSKDVLASPRVTTISGEMVNIKLTTTTYFVEDYEEAELQTTTSALGGKGYTFKSSFPNFEGEARELGINFSVRPTLDNERRLITMPLNPSIKSLVGWTLYQGTTEDGMEEELRTPIIADRSVNTTVEVSDGDTIVLGGVISDTVNITKNQIPILGDIPLIGRLFQSRSEQSEKKNLLIFVTPRLVRPDGTLCYPDAKTSSRGIVNFF